MCDQPQEKDGLIFACRTCDSCIAARRANWVARAMAETTQHNHAVCVTLTYDDKAPGGYDAARFFAYYDVRGLVQRITAALRRIDQSLKVRFLCAGEQGDRNGRCHWHLILWSDYDLRRLGEVTLHGKVLTDPEAMMSKGKRKRRLHWSLWARDKHRLGFVTFGAADEAGAKYVVSYCLKDQFTSDKSRGKARFTKSENFATGLFRMSKRPAIGEAWLMQKLQGLSDLAAVLPNTNLRVPGLSGYWYPSGVMRQKLLTGLRAINDERNRSGLGDAPQWPGLLTACQDNPSDMEILLEPEIEQITFEDNLRYKEIDLEQKTRDRRAFFHREYTLRCDDCVSTSEGRGGIIAGQWGFSASSEAATFGPSRGKVLYPTRIYSYLRDETPCCERCGDHQKVYAYPRGQT